MKLGTATLVFLLATPGWIVAQDQEKDLKAMNEPHIRFLNRAPGGYSQVVEVRGGRTLYISGQIALDSSGQVVGSGDFTPQIKQVFVNLKARLALDLAFPPGKVGRAGAVVYLAR